MYLKFEDRYRTNRGDPVMSSIVKTVETVFAALKVGGSTGCDAQALAAPGPVQAAWQALLQRHRCEGTCLHGWTPEGVPWQPGSCVHLLLLHASPSHALCHDGLAPV